MTNKQQPDGYCAWHPKKGFLGNTQHRIYKIKYYADRSLAAKVGRDNWEIRPVCLVPPELLNWVARAAILLDKYFEQPEDNLQSDKLLAELEQITLIHSWGE